MKVLMVTPSFYPIEGGAEQMVANLATELNRSGIRTDVMTFNMDKKWNPSYTERIERIKGLTVIRIPAFNWFPLTHSKRITLGINLIPGRFQNRLNDYDIIHFSHGDDLSFPLFSILERKQKILHLYDLDPDFYKRYFLSRQILKNVANLFIVYQKVMKQQLIDLGISQYKIKYLPNGIDVNVFCPSKEKEDNLVLFVGRISLMKGLHVLLKSLDHLEKPVHLVIIGPSDWDTTYFKRILATIASLNENSIHTVTYLGKLERNQTIEWYQKASIVVRPDLLGVSGGLTALEASACGTPVIGTGNEVVKPDVSGILVPPNNDVKLAKAIQYLLDNKDVRERLGGEGRRWVLGNFSFKAVVERLRKIYQELPSYY